MKKCTLICMLLTFFSYVFCGVPKWLSETEKEYPTEFFIRAIGEGSTIKSAEQTAISSVSLAFNAKVKVINNAVKDFNSIITENKSELSKSYAFHQENTVLSESELFCLKFTDSYFNKKEKKYFICAYINREEASDLYEQKIDAFMSQIRVMLDAAKNEKESMYQLLNYQKMAKLGKIAAYYIDTARIISPKQNEKYNHYEKLFSQIQGNIQNQKKKNSFSIKCNDKNCSAIIAGLSSILEESGFVISPNNSIYKILVDIHFIEEEYEAGNFVRPDILITILNGNGSVIDSYSKAYPRYSHQNMKNAYSLAFVRIEQDLEENFLVDYRGE